jgi:phage baseplate assembly protein W
MNKSLFAVDLSLNFRPHPTTKDAPVVIDQEAVKRAVRNLVLLKRNEKPFHPEISSGVTDLLFENPIPIVITTLKKDVADFISRYEPRARSIDVDVARITTGDIVVTISFVVQNQKVSVSAPIQVQRTR